VAETKPWELRLSRDGECGRSTARRVVWTVFSRDGYLERIGKHVIFAGFNLLLPITEGTGKRETLVSEIDSNPNQSGWLRKESMSWTRRYKPFRDLSRIRDSLKKCMQTLGSAPSKISSTSCWGRITRKSNGPRCFVGLGTGLTWNLQLFFDKAISKTLMKHVYA